MPIESFICWMEESLYSHPLKSPFLRDSVEIQYLAEMGFLRDDYEVNASLPFCHSVKVSNESLEKGLPCAKIRVGE